MGTTCSGCAAEATTTCYTCHKPLCNEHALRWHPLITARQLATTTVNTAIKTPTLLSDIMFKEMEQVNYCEDCRELVGERRQSEQIKFMLGLLLLVALVIGMMTLMMLR